MIEFSRLLFLGCLFLAPALSFLARNNTSATIKSARLIVPILLFSLLILYAALPPCFPSLALGCFVFKFSFSIFAILLYIMYIGWLEYLQRRLNMKTKRPLKRNYQYGVVSNAVLLTSACMTLLMAVLMTLQMILWPLFHGN